MPIAEYSPAQVKKTIVGRGAALKPQVGYMVAQLLRLRSAPAPADAADGVAVALTHLHHRHAAGGVLPPGDRRAMIATRDRRARGPRRARRIVVQTDGGVGYEVTVPLGVAGRLPPTGGRVSLHTELVVKEDGWSLFGFDRPAERQVFQRLLGASGFGPKLALALLSALGAGAHGAQRPGAGPGGAQLGERDRPEEGGAAGAGAAGPVRRCRRSSRRPCARPAATRRSAR